MKKTICIIMFMFILTLSFKTNSFGYEIEKRITVCFDDDTIADNKTETYDSVYIDENNRTMVPFRKCLEEIGAKVEWDSKNKIAKATYNNIKVEIPIGKKYILINGAKKEIDTVAAVKYARVFLPARAVFEAFGFNVEWGRNKSDVIRKGKVYVTENSYVLVTSPDKELEKCNLISDSDKIDSSKKIIYRIKTNTKKNAFSNYTSNYVRVPYVNIDIPAVREFNDIMLKKNKFFEKHINELYDEFINTPYDVYRGIIPYEYSSYTYGIRDNVLSVYQTDKRRRGITATNAFNVINVDLINKKALSYYEMLDRFNLTLDDVKKAIIDKCNDKNTYDVYRDEIDMYVKNYVDRINMKDRLFYEDYDPNISLEESNIVYDSPSIWMYKPTKSYIYINEEGQVCTNFGGAFDVVIEGVVLK